MKGEMILARKHVEITQHNVEHNSVYHAAVLLKVVGDMISLADSTGESKDLIFSYNPTIRKAKITYDCEGAEDESVFDFSSHTSNPR